MGLFTIWWQRSQGKMRERRGGNEREKRENQAEILLPFVANLIQGNASFNKLRQFQRFIQHWCWRGRCGSDCTSAWKAPPCHSRSMCSGICMGVSTSGKCILTTGRLAENMGNAKCQGIVTMPFCRISDCNRPSLFMCAGVNKKK